MGRVRIFGVGAAKPRDQGPILSKACMTSVTHYFLAGIMGLSQPASSDGFTFFACPSKAKVLGW